MAAIVEVKYFNTFLLKKINSSQEIPMYNGSFGIPENIGGYPRETSFGTSEWTVEESRIRGGYNNTNVDYGVRAYLVEEEPNGSIRSNSLIWSGIFNSRTGINRTNEFSVGEDITKSADPANGSIQKLYAEDTNLTVFQENKISRALIDKDAIYSAEGGGAVTSSNLVIGVIQPYAGNFGISRNPESFAVYGYRKYFTDKDRNAVLRLSQDGITEISNYGMYDYFRDEFNRIDDVTGEGRIVGGWDIHNKQYIVSSRNNISSSNTDYNTLSYDESVLGWTSFFTYKPDYILSIKNKMFTLKDNKLWQHYRSDVERANFYGVQYISSITFVLNPNVSLIKNFQTINYEGSNGWEVTQFQSSETGYDSFNGVYSIATDIGANNTSTTKIYSYSGGEYILNPADGQPVVPADYVSVFGTVNPPYPRERAGFNRKENKYVANLINTSDAKQGEIRYGNEMTGIKGFYATVTINTDTTTDVGGPKELFAVSSNYVESSY